VVGVGMALDEPAGDADGRGGAGEDRCELPLPANAPSDGPNMIPMDAMPALIARLAAFDRLAKGA
ncbi:MAG: hypothetical protein AAFY66_05100, partial [Pseudomonadota bacterium]